jgi:hypothetical protein
MGAAVGMGALAFENGIDELGEQPIAEAFFCIGVKFTPNSGRAWHHAEIDWRSIA